MPQTTTTTKSSASSYSSFEIINGGMLRTLLADEVWVNASRNPSNVTEINFFDIPIEDINGTIPEEEIKKQGISACIFTLEDTIRLAEWLPYHYTVLPLKGLIIGLDPKTTDKGLERIMELINLWKDKIEITLWPDFVIPDEKRSNMPWYDDRQVYFANRCLVRSKEFNRGWTLNTDTDEYMIYNYYHEGEENLERWDPHIPRFKNKVMDLREKNKPLRETLPSLTQQSISSYVNEHDFEMCLRMPMNLYGLSDPYKGYKHNDIINVDKLTTIYQTRHEERKGRTGKLMLDLTRAPKHKLEGGRGRTIHNPNQWLCGKNGATDAAADYPAAVFRLNHYVGSYESFMERNSDHRGGSMQRYMKKLDDVKQTAHQDFDIVSWIDVFVQRVGKEEAVRLLSPLGNYFDIERDLQRKYDEESNQTSVASTE
jgi:hypothetical protein